MYSELNWTSTAVCKYDADLPVQLKQAVLTELKDKTLQPLPETVTKIIQLYETKNSRHSTMIVGVTLSGKTVTWRNLQSTLSRLCKEGEPGFAIVKVLVCCLNFTCTSSKCFMPLFLNLFVPVLAVLCSISQHSFIFVQLRTMECNLNFW